jgi:uncharacterized FlgJ-related protein
LNFKFNLNPREKKIEGKKKVRYLQDYSQKKKYYMLVVDEYEKATHVGLQDWTRVSSLFLYVSCG